MRTGRPSSAAALAALAALSSLLAPQAWAAEEPLAGPLYLLPAPAGTVLSVAAGPGEVDGRSPDEEHAYEFVASDGDARFEVAAARGGTVIGARSGVVGGRCDAPPDGPRPPCWREVNYVLIDHGDGTSALYTHLRRGALPVRIGEVVARGQPLGVAGSSGWTDGVVLGFQVQPTPRWDEQGQGGWFMGTSLPVAFGDADVLSRHPPGKLEAGDEVASANAAPAFEPFRFRPRPASLPAAVPFGEGVERWLSGAYEADSPDGYGLHIAPAVGQPPVAVRPLFGGEVAFAGCATGASAPLGRTVVVQREVEDVPFFAVHGHLLDIEPELLEAEPGADPAAPPAADPPPLAVGASDPVGRFGEAVPGAADAAEPCPGTDGEGQDLFVTILREATVSPEGEIVGGTPVSPEPLVGHLGYEGFAWWAGPLRGGRLSAEEGRPSARWHAATSASGSHVRYGQPVRLRARVRDAADIAQVRFHAWYPRWPSRSGSRALPSFDPASSWRLLAACDAPGTVSGVGNLCDWEGDEHDARVTYVWDPRVAMAQPAAPWLPRARPATARTQAACLPVSLAVEVIDTAGQVRRDIARLPRPARCDDPAAESADGARVLYLDPLVPPIAPAARGRVRERGWPPVYQPDPLEGAIVWRDRSDNEDGFRIYARRHWFRADCSIAMGPWRLVTTVAANRERYRPRHGRVRSSLALPEEAHEAPGSMDFWEYAVSAHNTAGETELVRVGGFVGGSEAFCDVGLEEPPPGEAG